ncbi:hypothetical protein PSACC_02831 [Paramicrosporidium saccamoebae]|uniref:RRM domain-containing protein n=1 Tax=Paramicrosporidium saccamoebae TaxID=1246581 RepID=A0A2H9THS1_9FUNG|nr:hypothetical protein PSACC_02831 [Paramicrosporidium saccamoebae]
MIPKSPWERKASQMQRPYGSQDDLYQTGYYPRQVPRHPSQEYVGDPYGNYYHREERSRAGLYYGGPPAGPCYPGGAFSGFDNYGAHHRGYHEDPRGPASIRAEYDVERYDDRYFVPAGYPPAYPSAPAHPHYTNHPPDYGRGGFYNEQLGAYDPNYQSSMHPQTPLSTPVPAPVYAYHGLLYHTPQSHILLEREEQTRKDSPSSRRSSQVIEYVSESPSTRHVQQCGNATKKEDGNSLVEQDFIKSRAKRELPCRTLFIRNVSAHAEKSQVSRVLEKYGAIRVLHDEHIEDKGFFDLRHAERAKEELQGFAMMGRKDEVSGPCSEDKHQGTLIVCIQNTTYPYTNADVKRLFGKHGDIKGVRDFHRISNKKFVEFFDERDCQSAYVSLNGNSFKGGKLSIRFSWDYPRDMRAIPNQIRADLERKEKSYGNKPSPGVERFYEKRPSPAAEELHDRRLSSGIQRFGDKKSSPDTELLTLRSRSKSPPSKDIRRVERYPGDAAPGEINREKTPSLLDSASQEQHVVMPGSANPRVVDQVPQMTGHCTVFEEKENLATPYTNAQNSTSAIKNNCQQGGKSTIEESSSPGNTLMAQMSALLLMLQVYIV